MGSHAVLAASASSSLLYTTMILAKLDSGTHWLISPKELKWDRMISRISGTKKERGIGAMASVLVRWGAWIERERVWEGGVFRPGDAGVDDRGEEGVEMTRRGIFLDLQSVVVLSFYKKVHLHTELLCHHGAVCTAWVLLHRIPDSVTANFDFSSANPYSFIDPAAVPQSPCASSLMPLLSLLSMHHMQPSFGWIFREQRCKRWKKKQKQKHQLTDSQETSGIVCTAYPTSPENQRHQVKKRAGARATDLVLL